MKLLDLFSGIGGFSLAARWAGIETIAFVEIDKFCHKVLEKNFNGKIVTDTEVTGINGIIRNMEQMQGRNAEPNRNYQPIPIYPDITKFYGTIYRGAVDIISGGFPCQPFSCAGKRRGKEDDRFLWPEMLRVISEVRPRWIIGENVTGIIGMELDNCISDLEGEGYEVQPFIIPACAVNAPHRRDRVWIVGYSEHSGSRKPMRTDGNGEKETGEWRGERGFEFRQTDCHAPDTTRRRWEQCLSEGQQKDNINKDDYRQGWSENWLEVATRLCRVDDGVSNRVDRLKSLGNAIVPQVAYQIMKAIVDIEQTDYIGYDGR